jgi:hypothetical protein
LYSTYRHSVIIDIGGISLIDSIKFIVACAFLLGLFAYPVLGVTTQLSGEGFSSQSNYNLGQSSYLKDDSMITGDGIFKSRSVGGSGESSVGDLLVGGKGSVINLLYGSGSLSSYSTSFASKNGAFSSQESQVNGESGCAASTASSRQNTMAMAGSFSGVGSMALKMEAIASGNAAIGGSVNFGGLDLLRGIGGISSTEDTAAITEGLFLDGRRAVGDFGMTLLNQKGDGTTAGDLLPDGTHPELKIAGGNAINYVFPREVYPDWPVIGKAYNQIGSPIKYYLQANSDMTNENLYVTDVTLALNDAAQTWDSYTSKSLFQSVEPAPVTTGYAVGMHDQKNVIGWLNDQDDSYLAYNNYWITFSGNKWLVTESDIVFNGCYGWTTDWGAASREWTATTLPEDIRVDVQTAALHELGHTVGLGDLYLLPSTDRRTQGPEIMNNYRRPQHNLGAGDIAGLQKIYGR